MIATSGLAHPTPELVRRREALFADLTDAATVPRFFDSVADDVSWTLHGRHPLAGEYPSKKAFLDRVIRKYAPLMLDGLSFRVWRLHVGDPVTVAEMGSGSTLTDGKPYDQSLVWVCTFDERDLITDVHHYADSVSLIELVRNSPA